MGVLIDLSNYGSQLTESLAGRTQTTGSITASVVASTRTISRSTGSFLVDRFKPGQWVVTAGFAQSGNNGTWLVESVAANGLSIVVLDPSSLLVDESDKSGVTITSDDDGNIFFDTENGKIELITAEELATLRLPTGVKSALITCSVNKTAKTFTRSAGSFLDDGFTVGKRIRTYGFTNPGNNVNFAEISSVTATVITLVSDPGNTLADETGNGDEKVIEFGASAVANPLANQEGIFIGAVYAFERQQRRVNEFLRQYDFYEKGTFKYAGAYELVNGRLFSTTGSSVDDDREKLRGSGWLERDTAGNVTATYFGVRSLGNIEDTSQPYYQLAEGGAPANFTKDGAIDEAIAVSGAMNYLSNKVRTYGQNYDEKTLVDSGIAEMSGFSAGFALGESPHLTTIPATYPLADVYGTAQKSPFTGMSLEKFATPQTRGGFVSPTEGQFSWILHNDQSVETVAIVSGGSGYAVDDILTVVDGTVRWSKNAKLKVTEVTGGVITAVVVDAAGAGAYITTPSNPVSVTGGTGTGATFNLGWQVGILNEIVAFMDALSQTDDDIDSGAETVTRGKRVRTLYYYDAAGRHITRRGFEISENKGIHIDDVPTADRQRVRFYDDDGDLLYYPFVIAFNIVVGSNADLDPNGWFHVWKAVGYGTSEAETVLDYNDEEMKGSTYESGGTVSLEYDSADGDQDIVIECEGDGVATQAMTEASLNDTDAVQTVVCSPGLETNM